MPITSGPINYEPIGSHATYSNLSSDQQIGIPAGADGVILQAISQNVRVRLDGAAATASIGFQLRAGDPPQLFPFKSNSILHVIQEAATATLQVQAVRLAGQY